MKEEKQQLILAERFVRELLAHGVSLTIIEKAVKNVTSDEVKSAVARADLAPRLAEILAEIKSAPPAEVPLGIYVAYETQARVRVKRTGKEALIFARVVDSHPWYRLEQDGTRYWHHELELLS